MAHLEGSWAKGFVVSKLCRAQDLRLSDTGVAGENGDLVRGSHKGVNDVVTSEKSDNREVGGGCRFRRILHGGTTLRPGRTSGRWCTKTTALARRWRGGVFV